MNLRMRGVMSIRMSCCPSAIGLYSSRLPVAVPLGISQIMASCQDSGTSAPRRIALYACTRSPCTGSGSSAMRAAVTRLDPGALSSSTACLTASLRSCRMYPCTDLHSSGTPLGMWARTSRSKASRFTGRLAYSASQYLWT